MSDRTGAPPTTTLDALADEAWAIALVADPLAATARGEPGHDHRLPPIRTADRAALAERLANLQDSVDEAVRSSTGTDDEIGAWALADFVGYARRVAAADVLGWAVDPLDGPQVALLNVPSYHAIREPADGEAAIARWAAMAPWIDDHVATFQESAAAGRVAPGATIRRVIDELDDLLAAPLEVSPLLGPSRTPRPDWPAPARERFAAAIEASVAELQRAFGRYRAFLAEELLPIARPDDRAGMSEVAGGAAAYRELVAAHTTLDLDPDAIHAIGLAEIERIDAEFAELGARILGAADRPATLARLRSDPELHFSTSAEVEAVARASLERANAATPGCFGRLPRIPCEVVVMAAHESKHSTIAYYRNPAGDGSRPGQYYINTSEPTTRPRYEAEVLAFHEAVPGHHLQIAIAQELDGLPAFRRFAGPTAHIEGWALYIERLADEMGLLSGDLDRFGILSFDAWRASRLVIDTGIHALGWSRETAIAFMLEHTALAPNNIANEVDRYIAIPGQALAYKLGQREIVALRATAEDRLGARFDLRGFHDAVLGDGAVGLGTLRRIVDRWVRERAA